MYGPSARARQPFEIGGARGDVDEPVAVEVPEPWKKTMDRVNALLKEGKDDEAVAVLEKAVADAPEGRKSSLQGELDDLRAGAARNRAVRQYNEALAQWQRGELQAALAGFEHVVSTATEPGVVKAAAENARLVRDAIAKKKKR